MEYLMQIAKDYGLFVALAAYVLWDTHKREQRYLDVIDTLSKDVQKQLVKLGGNLGKVIEILNRG